MILDCSQIVGQNKIVAEKSGNITLKWEVFNPEVDSIYKIYFNTKHKEAFIGDYIVRKTTSELTTVAGSPFSSRAKGKLNLVNGTGTLELTIENLQ